MPKKTTRCRCGRICAGGADFLPDGFRNDRVWTHHHGPTGTDERIEGRGSACCFGFANTHGNPSSKCGNHLFAERRNLGGNRDHQSNGADNGRLWCSGDRHSADSGEQCELVADVGFCQRKHSIARQYGHAPRDRPINPCDQNLLHC